VTVCRAGQECIKLVITQNRIKMHGQQNIKFVFSIYLLFDKLSVAPTIQRQAKDDLYFIRKAVFVRRNDDLIE
jgi:hypothetical protein